jgi:hypothetical protein
MSIWTPWPHEVRADKQPRRARSPLAVRLLGLRNDAAKRRVRRMLLAQTPARLERSLGLSPEDVRALAARERADGDPHDEDGTP